MLDDTRYLFSNDAVEMASQVLRGVYDGDFEHYSYWMDDAATGKSFQTFHRPQNLAKLSAQLQQRRAVGNTYDLHRDVGSFANIDENVMSIIEAHPEIEFILYVPPVSTLSYALKSPNAVVRALKMRRYLLDQIKGLENARLHAFDDVNWIVADIGNYKNLSHYGEDINAYILRSIQGEQHRLTAENIDDHLRAFLALVERYEIDGH